MRRVSVKTRRKRAARLKAVRLAAQRQGWKCAGLELLKDHQCIGPLVGHEPLKRSAGGDACDPDEVMVVCAWLNCDIEDRPWIYKDTPFWISGGTLYQDGRYLKASER